MQDDNDPEPTTGPDTDDPADQEIVTESDPDVDGLAFRVPSVRDSLVDLAGETTKPVDRHRASLTEDEMRRLAGG